jgi:penicillin-binding protein 2
VLNDASTPLLNRATRGVYRPASLFKIIAAAAGMERGGMNGSTLFNDPGIWEGLPGYPKACWINKVTGHGHGTLSLEHAITVSCDVVFYQVGQRLDQLDRNLMPDFSRAFGLGQKTGIELDEETGDIPNPNEGTWRPGDPVNMAIGQQDIQRVTPLQIADIMAAIANGGTLYRPRLLGRISDIVTGLSQTPPPEARGKLPVGTETLAVLRRALAGVTSEKDGTAYLVFQKARVTVAGKTGTDQTDFGDDNSWFAAYAPADNPQIAIVVIVEHGGEGSKTAAPIVRQIVDEYFARGQ